MKEYMLKRSGQRALTFTGDELASVSTFSDNGPGNLRYWNISVFKTESDQFVLCMAWFSRWQGENEYDSATVHESLADVATALEAHDPLSRLIGFPSDVSGKYADRQRHIETVLRQQWQNAVSEILGDLDIAERI